jgi:type I restriction-modification system DNA methylase subunit
VTDGGRVAVIVPVSAMIGKTKEDKQIKKEILKHHTLTGVISLNKNTFYKRG